MKKRMGLFFRNLRLPAVAALIVLVSGITAGTAPKKGVLIGYAVIPDIVKTVDVMEKIAVRVKPETFKPGSIKGQAGMMLNDPSLDNIDRKNPVVMAVYYSPMAGAGTPSVRTDIAAAVFIPAKNAAKYKKVFDGMNQKSVVKGNVLILGSREDILATASNDLAVYKKIAASKIGSDMRFTVKIDSLMTVYKKEITQAVKSLQSMDENMDGNDINENMVTAVALAKLFIYGFMDMIEQSKDYQLDIMLNENTIQLASEHSSRPGTPLKKLFDGNVPAKNRCIGIIPDKMELTYAGYFDMKSFDSFIDSVIKNSVKRDSSISKSLNSEFISVYRKFLGIYIGEYAIAYGLDAKGRLSFDSAATTEKTLEEHLDVNEKFIEAYNKIMNGLGNEGAKPLTYTLDRNVRKSGGFDIHRYTLNVNPEEMDDQTRDAVKKMVGEKFSAEFTVLNGFYVISTSPARLDKMIKNAANGGGNISLQAVKVYGGEMDSYIDLDLVKIIKGMSLYADMLSQEGEKDEINRTVQALEKLSDSDRIITASSKYRKGVSFNNYRVSVDLIAELIKAASEQQSRGGEETGLD